MSNIVLAVIVLGGCLLMHLWMMKKGGHAGHGGHSNNGDEEKKKDGSDHSGHSCH